MAAGSYSTAGGSLARTSREGFAGVSDGDSTDISASVRCVERRSVGQFDINFDASAHRDPDCSTVISNSRCISPLILILTNSSGSNGASRLRGRGLGHEHESAC